MTADESFEKLGFKHHKNKVQEFFDRKCNDIDGDFSLSVIFWHGSKEVEIQSDDDGVMDGSVIVSRPCIDAISLKCRELGWS